MSLKSAFKVGDCLHPIRDKNIEPLTGNCIIAGRKFKDGEIQYTLFTDFGNTVVLSEKDVIHHYECTNSCEVERWLIERRDLANEQLHNFMTQPWVFSDEQIKQ